MNQNSAVELVEENTQLQYTTRVQRICSSDIARKRLIFVMVIILFIFALSALVFNLYITFSNKQQLNNIDNQKNQTIQTNDTSKNNQTQQINNTYQSNITSKDSDQKYIENQQSNLTKQQEQILPEFFVINNKDKITITKNGMTINNINISKVQNLTLNDSTMFYFDTSYFFNLKYLNVGDNTNLLSLTINQSRIVEFSINSSSLISLLIIENNNITTFSNCSFPNLRNLTVIKSNIHIWQNNSFGKLQYLSFIENQIVQIPVLDIGIKTFILIKCYGKSYHTFSIDFKKYSKLQIIHILETSYFDIKIKDISVQKITIVNSNSYIIIQNCSSLSHLTIQQQFIWDLQIKNNPNIMNGSIKSKLLNQLKVNDNINFQNINFQIDKIKNIYLQGKKFYEFPFHDSQIQRQSTLSLNNTSINETQFSKINIDNIVVLKLESNQQLNKLNHTFMNLRFLILINQVIEFNQMNAPLIFQIEFQNFQKSQFTIPISNYIKKLEFIIFKNCKIDILNVSIIHVNIYIFSSIINYFVTSQSQMLRIVSSYINIVNQTLLDVCYFQLTNSNLTCINNTISCQKNNSYFFALHLSRKINNTMSLQNNIFHHVINLTAKYQYQNSIIFVNNSFQLLENLTISKINTFKNNYIPKLTKFQYLSQLNKNLTSLIIEELILLEKNGSHLQSLTMNCTQQEQTKIRQIYPNITINKK